MRHERTRALPRPRWLWLDVGWADKRNQRIWLGVGLFRGSAMTEDLERLISAAERVSRVWRLGSDKTKDNIREAINELDWSVKEARKNMGREETKRMEKP